ncbi:hypothetical protein FZI02_20830 [Cronobacter sakazakii]|uniref:phage baseplate plug family protein n=1 Tax=Cronobacter sakazakii TaxID=28141 RepID=UPI0013262E2F|nr:hypothetical protein [Cronobacter sakazakii]EGT5186455.1 hypothetical protein [Cronobacter sakazakii]EJG0748350.1 hypothetical protein [Cronobacter sakazakii]ELY2536545.1 hypothetical protein [Cronobacter sakazakii]ELY2540606.1 hypothetical protein [Cronobacter sakazakii]ELY4823284.1 hypothetical protein [Cronobacter sakazakii]
MQASEIPLSPDNQRFSVAINGVNYTIRTLWRDDAGWVIDLLDGGGADIVTGIPLVTGANLLEPFSYLELGFGLVVLCDDPLQDYPTKTGLGITSHLWAVTE